MTNKIYQTIVNSDSMGITLHVFRDLVKDLQGNYYIAESENAQFAKETYYKITEIEAEKIINMAKESIKTAYYHMEDLKGEVLDREYQNQ